MDNVPGLDNVPSNAFKTYSEGLTLNCLFTLLKISTGITLTSAPVSNFALTFFPSMSITSS